MAADNMNYEHTNNTIERKVNKDIVTGWQNITHKDKKKNYKHKG